MADEKGAESPRFVLKSVEIDDNGEIVVKFGKSRLELLKTSSDLCDNCDQPFFVRYDPSVCKFLCMYCAKEGAET